MENEESRVHQNVVNVFDAETEEKEIAQKVRESVHKDLAQKFPSQHTGCLSCTVVEAIAANIYFDRKKFFEENRSDAEIYLQNHAGNSSYAVQFSENGKKYWLVHSGYDALPSKIANMEISVEKPKHMGCCGE